MKINRIKLKNYIGIFEGMGLKELEIDFNKNIDNELLSIKNNVVILAGKNGSGKSTLMSTLHPFSGTQDNRDKIILEGTEGYKEIEIQHHNDIYLIQHYYKKSIKSYIQKNGVELNENGNVTSFKEVVKDELDVDESYFKIGKIGSNVTSFIDFSTAERKKYINKFLPNIDDWVSLFNIVKDKSNLSKKDIKYVSEQLQKLDDIENIKISIESYNQKLNTENSKLLKLQKSAAILQNSIDTKIKENNLEEGNIYKKPYLSAKNDFQVSSDKVDRYFAKYPKLEDYTIDKCNSVINSNKTKLEVTTNEISSIKKSLDEKRSLLSKNNTSYKEQEAQLEDLIKNGSYDELKELYSEKESELKNIESKMKQYSFSSIETSYKDILSISSTLDNFNRSLKRFKDEDSRLLDFLLKENLDMNHYNKLLIEYKQLVSNSKINLDKYKSRLNLYQNNLSLRSKLDLRPDKCRIDTCPFIRDAVKFKNVEADIIKAENAISKVESDIERQESNVELIKNVITIFNQLENLYNNFSDFDFEIIKKAKLKCMKNLSTFENFVDTIKLTKSEIDELFDIDDIKEYLELKESYTICKDQLDNIGNNLKILESQLSFIETAKVNLEKLSNEISELKNEISELEENLEDENLNLSKYNEKINILKDLVELLNTKSESEKIMNENHDNYFNIKSILASIEEEETEIKDINNEIKIKEKEIKNITTELDQWKLKENQYYEYQERKEKLESSFETIELIKKSLDPMKGIPIFFTKNYLVETAKIANELLDIAYKGKFQINFDLSDKNFYIQVITNDKGIKNDIIEASQGEVALTTISLSLAMIEQSVTKYNIILLDEIDATLDANNRINFINMIEMQIEKLGIEQIFIISHNNQFDTYGVDIVALKDHGLDLDNHTFMNGKNLIFNVYNK